MRKIKTEFGEMEIAPDDIIHFEKGLYGFEQVKEYVLINHDENGLIMTMQSAESQMPQFVVLDPYAVIADYSPKLSKADLTFFQNKKVSELKFLVIAVVCENYLETVVNLKSPIVIDPISKKALQVFLENTNYSIKYKVFDDKGDIKC
ncbi:MAG: flagellar assembly protein FliW [Oscillospiraceae bacterium]